MSRIDAMKRHIEDSFGDILQAEFPAFSAEEMARRDGHLTDLLQRRGLEAVIVAEAMRAGTATGWLTGWPVTAEAVTLFLPGDPKRMFIQHYNHLPLARRIARATEVEWGGPSGIAGAVAALKTARPAAKRLGLIGRLGPAACAGLAQDFELTDLNADYARLRMVKSDEELRWLRLAAALTDLGVTGLAEGARAGLRERELGPLVEAPFLPYGATSFLHYFLSTPMQTPDVGVPRQYSSNRRLAEGDVLACEISADFWGYTGQVLRTFFMAAEPDALYAELHACAEAALGAVLAKVRPGAHARDLVAASGLIEEAGYTIIDDLVHGYGGGYLPPILGSKSRPAAIAEPDVTLEKNMALVVQPNVVTRDGSAGVQTGHLVLVTDDGYEPLQRYPAGYQVL